VWAPSATASSIAPTVTVCGTFHVAGVKVIVAGAAVTWASPAVVMTTLAAGIAVSTSV